MIHFTLVTASEDFVYGQEGALELAAVVSPDQAINNADSHEYFAENAPFLPMAAAYLPVNRRLRHKTSLRVAPKLSVS